MIGNGRRGNRASREGCAGLWFPFSCYEGDPLRWLDQMGHGAHSLDQNGGLLLVEAELLPQNAVELGQDERRDEKVDLPSADTRKDLIRLAPREDKGGDQHACVEDDAHVDLFSDLMDDSVHIFFGPNPEGLSLQGCLALKLPPTSFLEVEAQGLPDQLTLGSVFFPGGTLSLSEKLWRKGDGPRLGGPHNVTS